jgi:hypothetical protein
MKNKKAWLLLILIPLFIACGGEDDHGDGTNLSPPVYSPKYTLTAWNDLGMHCMDGKDFSVFSVLPPYNNIHAQLRYTDSIGLIKTNVTLTYEAIPDSNGLTNTTSVNKTNFWTYVQQLFNITLAPDVGLTGNPTPSITPANMTFNTANQWWEAEGIPITPYTDDNVTKNYYPLVKIVAKDVNGTVLASTQVVLPVSDEMDCKKCHASNSNAAARPTAGWINDINLTAEQDYKYNILRLHDQIQPTAVSTYKAALLASPQQYDYNITGLEATAKGGTPVLCAACHKTNALPNVGIGFNPNAPKAFTSAIHSRHANVIDPSNNMTLDNSNNRNACYTCHPGSATNCLRGAMGDAKDASGQNTMQCQSCHGSMTNVGDLTREGWFNEPNCQACHHDAIRETSAINVNGTLKTWVDTRFATNANTPAANLSLYRFSTGHGNLQCEACHGSTHAVFPAHTADNLMSINAQGHSGTVAECKTCHATIPATVTGGPHGMHPVGDYWVSAHQNIAKSNPGQCTACHGATYRGSVLSKTWTNRSFYNGKSYQKGSTVTCYDCHNGPSGDD